MHCKRNAIVKKLPRRATHNAGINVFVKFVQRQLLIFRVILTAVSTKSFPEITGMWPRRGMTAGGSRITFYGERLNVFLPLGAYFTPPENTGLDALYGFACTSCRSET